MDSLFIARSQGDNLFTTAANSIPHSNFPLGTVPSYTGGSGPPIRGSTAKTRKQAGGELTLGGR